MSDPRVITSRAAFRDVARESLHSTDGDATPTTRDPCVRVPVEVRLTVSDPFLAYRRARLSRDEFNATTEAGGGRPRSAVLETTGGQSGWGYFGIDPIDRMTASAEAVTWSDDADGNSPVSTREPDSPSLAALESLLAGTTLARGDCDVPVPCGAISWLSYDIARELEALPSAADDDRGLPRLEVAVYDRLASWQAPTDDAVTLRITACPLIDSTREGRAETSSAAVAARANEPRFRFGPTEDELGAAYEYGRERALDLADRIREGDSGVGAPPVETPAATFESECGREAFAERVRRAKAAVRDGETFQANISQRLVAPAAVHPVAAYDAVRRVNPAPYSCLLEFGAVDLVSASPELLLECSATRGHRPQARDGAVVRTEPIAGTRPRGETPAADAELEADLRRDEKERAEHAMLVDLERNDLGKVCEYGSVDVAEYRRVDRYAEVMHLVSEVTGSLREEVALADAIAAVFPGGTITGAPKPRTMELIDELEATRRGPYTGSVGIFGFDGRATLNIVIRTLVRHENEFHLRVGAGIVHDSDPDREYDETLAKARALLNAVDEALGDRADMGLDAEREGSDTADTNANANANTNVNGGESRD
ncbi:anthranilate synthase component I family protein [Natrialba asiatica]|uniref:anthranilate synthase n=1 Tax=Natrialba asiatica (strain ATCC 700177 / DSM 12278 / JCM 9576 / FERM P-10747 / NBRC 102637 / 172P1) TaxID=29540 RepID=M0AKA6_NATA1|nr:anthranilate synthase component I family protein [Natrialba asiatica]ELY98796.1 para-aminobenzoate synthase component I [Natrialba asiatica DSM 12278]